MRMILLVSLPLLFIAFILTYFLEWQYPITDNLSTLVQQKIFSNLTWQAFYYVGLLGMLNLGSFRYYKFASWALFGLILLALGNAMRLMHWPFSLEILFIGAISFIIIYSIHFWKNKQAKGFLDWLKYIYLIIWGFLPAFRALIDGHIWEINWAVKIVTVFLFAVFYYTLLKDEKKNKLPELDTNTNQVFKSDETI